MKVSQRLEYACRAMIQLEKSCQGNQVLRVDDLAEKEHLSSTFLVQILNDLRRAGLVQSRRGKMGGYCLAAEAKDITLDLIVRAIEGGILDLDSDRAGESGARVADLWKDIAGKLEGKMATITLADMVGEAESLEYYI